MSKRFFVLCLMMMSLWSLSVFAQVNVDESQLIGDWCIEDTIPDSNGEAFRSSNAKVKGVLTYQSNRRFVWKINWKMDVNIDVPNYKNQLKIEYSRFFYGKWAIKKGDVLVQKMKKSVAVPIRIVADHEDSNIDKIYLPLLKSKSEENLLKEAKRMTKAGKEKILSINETEMVTEEGVYKRK